LTGNRRELIVITGPPGAGKSSVSEHLANLFEPSALVAGDSFFAMIKKDSSCRGCLSHAIRTPSSSRQPQLLLAG